MADDKKTTAAPNAGTGAGSPPVKPVATTPDANTPGNVAAPANAAQSIAQFGGTPSGRSNQFKFPVDTPEGQQERRDADAKRKRDRRAEAAKVGEPPPLPPAAPGVAGPTPAPDNQPGAVPPAQIVEAFVAWTPEDVQDFTDELVELSEARRIDQFVAVAKEAKLPAKFIIQLEKDAQYPVSSKKGLKRAIAATVAKWLNKSGISAKNKEEAALLFCLVTIKIQGFRVRRNLQTMIDSEGKREAKSEPVRPTAPAQPFATAQPLQPVVLPDPPRPPGAPSPVNC